MSLCAISVLLLEDVSALRTLWATSLTRAGFSVDSAASCAEAIGLIQRRSFDVLVLDHQLPDGKAVNVLRYAEENCIDARAIVVSGVAGPQDALDAGMHGAVRFLGKPVTSAVLATTIREVAADVPVKARPSPVVLARERIREIDVDAVDARAQCRSVVLCLMSDVRVDLASFATLADEHRKIACMADRLDLSSLWRTLDAIHDGTVIPDPQARLALDCIAASTERDSHRLADACGLPLLTLLTSLRTSQGQDIRYWTRMAKIRRSLPLVISGGKLGYLADASGFANAGQMSRDIHRVLGVTVTEVRASALATSGRRMP